MLYIFFVMTFLKYKHCVANFTNFDQFWNVTRESFTIRPQKAVRKRNKPNEPAFFGRFYRHGNHSRLHVKLCFQRDTVEMWYHCVLCLPRISVTSLVTFPANTPNYRKTRLGTVTEMLVHVSCVFISLTCIETLFFLTFLYALQRPRFCLKRQPAMINSHY